MIYFFTVLIVFDTAHTLSPMAMAWSRGDFREVMLRHWPRYVLVPLAATGCFGCCNFVGETIMTDRNWLIVSIAIVVVVGFVELVFGRLMGMW